MIRIVEAQYVAGYTIHLKFSDGLEGDVDLSDRLFGPVFAPLLDIDEFRKFVLHAELKTVVWPNGADFAPEFLYERVRVAA
jgi:Protein of unknown function (DUF2442)